MYINVDTQPCIAWNTSAIALPFYMTYFVGDVSYDIGPRQKVTVLQKYLGQFFFFANLTQYLNSPRNFTQINFFLYPSRGLICRFELACDIRQGYDRD